MNYSEIKPTIRKPTERRIIFANVGHGVGMYRGVNGPIIEYNTISGLGLDVRMGPDDRTITVDATSLIERLDALNNKYNTLSTAILSAESAARHGDSILKSRLGQLEARPGFQLPEALHELAQMPRFHGSVPVIQHGKWAALNLSNDFFNKYEAKMDACVAVGGDVQRSVKDYSQQLHEIRQNMEKMSETVHTLEDTAGKYKLSVGILSTIVLSLAFKAIFL